MSSKENSIVDSQELKEMKGRKFSHINDFEGEGDVSMDSPQTAQSNQYSELIQSDEASEDSRDETNFMESKKSPLIDGNYGTTIFKESPENEMGEEDDMQTWRTLDDAIVSLLKPNVSKNTSIARRNS